MINFAIGVVTGITLEFQFGTNWSRYSAYVGDIFGSLLAVEATLAFFLESTFIAVWWLGWRRLSPKAHAVTIWLVAGASNLSAYWILAANSFMQHPVGYAIRGGRAELTDFLAVITQKWALLEFTHTLAGAYTLAGFFVLGVAAWHLARRSHAALFAKAFRLAAPWSLVFAVATGITGDLSGQEVAEKQPTKLAAMESHWETRKGAPLYLLLWPDEAGEGNAVQALGVPGGLSFLAFHDFAAEVKGLKDFPPADRPPVMLTFLGFRLMVGLGTLFILVATWATWRRRAPEASPRLLGLLPWFIPLPYLALQAGWAVTEVGRQPWIVWGMMRTGDAVSRLATHQVGTSLIAFFLVYGILGIVAFRLMIRHAKAGPRPEPATAAGEEVAHA